MTTTASHFCLVHSPLHWPNGLDGGQATCLWLSSRPARLCAPCMPVRRRSSYLSRCQASSGRTRILLKDTWLHNSSHAQEELIPGPQTTRQQQRQQKQQHRSSPLSHSRGAWGRSLLMNSVPFGEGSDSKAHSMFLGDVCSLNFCSQMKNGVKSRAYAHPVDLLLSCQRQRNERKINRTTAIDGRTDRDRERDEKKSAPRPRCRHLRPGTEGSAGTLLRRRRRRDARHNLNTFSPLTARGTAYGMTLQGLYCQVIQDKR